MSPPTEVARGGMSPDGAGGTGAGPEWSRSGPGAEPEGR